MGGKGREGGRGRKGRKGKEGKGEGEEAGRKGRGKGCVMAFGGWTPLTVNLVSLQTKRSKTFATYGPHDTPYTP